MKIMLIDDDLDFLTTIQELLKDEGYDVYVSPQTFPELAEVAQVHPDLVILDLLFGDERHGWKLLERMKLLPATSKIPVILCSAAIREIQDMQDYLTSQHIRVLYKPFYLDALLAYIKQITMIYDESAADDAS